jgi:hypothetical protein
MSIWDRLLHLMGLRPTPGPRTYYFNASESLQVTPFTLSPFPLTKAVLNTI